MAADQTLKTRQFSLTSSCAHNPSHLSHLDACGLRIGPTSLQRAPERLPRGPDLIRNVDCSQNNQPTNQTSTARRSDLDHGSPSGAPEAAVVVGQLCAGLSGLVRRASLPPLILASDLFRVWQFGPRRAAVGQGGRPRRDSGAISQVWLALSHSERRFVTYLHYASRDILHHHIEWSVSFPRNPRQHTYMGSWAILSFTPTSSCVTRASTQP